jgi:branched-chain amino acid transport system ATP-binding protein
MTHILEGQQIQKNFGAFQVLKDVDFAVQEGDAIGVVGPNGAGKTTLFGVLAGSHPPTSGHVRFAGQEITSLDAAARCHLGIARTHQVPRPFLGMTVFENVLTAATHGGGLRGQDAYERSVEALELCNLLASANRTASTLGLLDRKRLELARALATGPKVLLLDEIGGGLTEQELKFLVATISELRARGMTIVWIEHILHALLRVIDRLVCMNAGSVIAEGRSEEVMADKAVVSAYLGSGIE